MKTSNKNQTHTLWAGAGLLVLSQLAAAHTPYLLPLTFSVSRPHVSLQAGVSDELFFVENERLFSHRITDNGPVGPSTPVSVAQIAPSSGPGRSKLRRIRRREVRDGD